MSATVKGVRLVHVYRQTMKTQHSKMLKCILCEFSLRPAVKLVLFSLCTERPQDFHNVTCLAVSSAVAHVDTRTILLLEEKSSDPEFVSTPLFVIIT